MYVHLPFFPAGEWFVAAEDGGSVLWGLFNIIYGDYILIVYVCTIVFLCHGRRGICGSRKWWISSMRIIQHNTYSTILVVHVCIFLFSTAGEWFVAVEGGGLVLCWISNMIYLCTLYYEYVHFLILNIFSFFLVHGRRVICGNRRWWISILKIIPRHHPKSLRGLRIIPLLRCARVWCGCCTRVTLS